MLTTEEERILPVANEHYLLRMNSTGLIIDSN